jgi:uncharacterized protein YbjT (DUF2867 family)
MDTRIEYEICLTRRESMRIAVVGGTGVVGRYTVEALRRAGHDTVVVARSRGVDISTGEGLDDALVGVDTVIDVTNMQAADAEATRNLFAAATRNLLAAEQRATVIWFILPLSKTISASILAQAELRSSKMSYLFIMAQRARYSFQWTKQFLLV